MSTARKILSNTVAQIIGKVFVAILGFAVVKISTNYLSLEGYGEYIIIYEFLAFFGIAADLGLFTIAVKEMSEHEGKIEKIIGNVLSLRTILVVTSMLIGIITVFAVPKYADTRVPIGVAIAAITFIVTILNGTITSVLQVKLQMGKASISTVLGKAVSVGVMVYVVFYGFPTESDTGFYMLILAGVIGNIASLMVTSYYVRKITPIRYQFDLKLWREVLVKSLPLGLALILNTIYFRVDSILISVIRGQEEVGIYGVAMKMLEHFAILPLYFMNSVLPVLTKSIKEKSTKYKKVISYSFDFLAAMSVPMVVGGLLLAYPIIFIVSQPEFLSRTAEGFYGSDVALQILILALLFQFLNILFAFILIAVNKQKKLLYINAICVVINITTNLIFIPEYGFIGAAFTSVFCEFFVLVATYIEAKRSLEFKVSLVNIGKIMFSALVMGVAIYYLQEPTYAFMQNWNVFLLIFLGMGIYVGMLFLTKTIDKEILRLIKKGEQTPHDGEPII